MYYEVMVNMLKVKQCKTRQGGREGGKEGGKEGRREGGGRWDESKLVYKYFLHY